MGISDLDPDAHGRRPWNAGNMVGAKRPLKPRDVWAIRFFLDEHRRLRDRALFDLAIDSKLRGCDIVKMKIGDVVAGGAIRNRATVMQQKTKRPVQFEIMTEARQTLLAWLNRRGGSHDDFIFPSRVNYMGHLSTRQYARLVGNGIRRAYNATSLAAPSPLPCDGRVICRAIFGPRKGRRRKSLSVPRSTFSVPNRKFSPISKVTI